MTCRGRRWGRRPPPRWRASCPRPRPSTRPAPDSTVREAHEHPYRTDSRLLFLLLLENVLIVSGFG
jgi:hypothetical protein